MGTMEAPVAIRRLDTDREDVFAFDVVGHINASDVENIYGLLEGAYAIHDQIDMLVRIKDYDGVEWDAALKDFNLLGKTHALKHIRLYAVVGGPAWVGPMIAVFNPFFRVKMKHFDETEEEAAWKWIGAREIPIKV
ncbi:MAG: STAS/SEC14 domain-containing protein [Rhizobiales bacterium 65-79]|nr:STAS/SEC14 domain-containing protein [Hyphomicrobiales bacterium]OJU05250.1 MAG: STAS/SEC14 domain-containing protein [Rhizobiales bacterium 65-79]